MQFHIFQDSRFEWRWQLSADDGRKIADSGAAYREKEDCMQAISQVKLSEQAIVLENATTLMHTEMLSMPGLFRQH